MADPPAPTPEPPSEITLEEWIESCQSCCGIEPESWLKPQPNSGEPKEDSVESDERRSAP